LWKNPVYSGITAFQVEWVGPFRRITSTVVVVRRLLSFDYVIEHPSLPWLATES